MRSVMGSIVRKAVLIAIVANVGWAAGVGAVMGVKWLSAAWATERQSSALQVPEQRFQMRITTEYSVSTYLIFQKSGKWICRTEAMPYLEAHENPLATLDWKRLQRGSISSACRRKVALEDTRSKPSRTAEGCLDDPAYREFVMAVDRACRP